MEHGANNQTGLGVWFFLNADRFVSWSTLSLLAVVVAYSMFWLPQIVRSVQGGRNTDLTAEYLIGTTICRLLLAFCLFLARSMFLGADLNPSRLPGVR